MVKMKEFTSTGGEESVRSMAENDDGGHELVVVKDGGDGKPVPEERAKRSDRIGSVDVIDWIKHDDDAADYFKQYEERWKESAHMCENKQEFQFIMDLERMEKRKLSVLSEMFYERRRHRRWQQQQQQQQQQQECLGNKNKMDDSMNTALTMNESFDSISTTFGDAVDDDSEKEEINVKGTMNGVDDDDDDDDDNEDDDETKPIVPMIMCSSIDDEDSDPCEINEIAEHQQQQQEHKIEQNHSILTSGYGDDDNDDEEDDDNGDNNQSNETINTAPTAGYNESFDEMSIIEYDDDDDDERSNGLKKSDKDRELTRDDDDGVYAYADLDFNIKALYQFGNLADDVTMPVSVSTTTSGSISIIEDDEDDDDDDDDDDCVRGKLFCFPDGTDVIDLVIGPTPTGQTAQKDEIEIVFDNNMVDNVCNEDDDEIVAQQQQRQYKLIPSILMKPHITGIIQQQHERQQQLQQQQQQQHQQQERILQQRALRRQQQQHDEYISTARQEQKEQLQALQKKQQKKMKKQEREKKRKQQQQQQHKYRKEREEIELRQDNKQRDQLETTRHHKIHNKQQEYFEKYIMNQSKANEVIGSINKLYIDMKNKSVSMLASIPTKTKKKKKKKMKYEMKKLVLELIDAHQEELRHNHEQQYKDNPDLFPDNPT